MIRVILRLLKVGGNKAADESEVEAAEGGE
jgi:hypothetical protein